MSIPAELEYLFRSEIYSFVKRCCKTLSVGDFLLLPRPQRLRGTVDSGEETHQGIAVRPKTELRVRFFKKFKIGLLNPKASENRFCVSLLNRSIQDLSNHGASKEPTASGFFGSFADTRDLGLICLV